MQLSLTHKFAFLCLPKCGSTSVEKALRKHCPIHLAGHPSLKHINATTFDEHIRPLLKKADPHREIETFCIMREPVDRVRSWYEYQLRPEIKDPSHRAHDRYNGHISYREFVEIVISKGKPDTRPRFARIGTQAGFIRLPDKSIGVDRIFRLDRMDEVTAYLSEKLGQPIEIRRENKSAGRQQKKGGLFRRGPQEEPDAHRRNFELPDDLLARLKDFLAADYEIYNNLARH